MISRAKTMRETKHFPRREAKTFGEKKLVVSIFELEQCPVSSLFGFLLSIRGSRVKGNGTVGLE